MERYRYGSLDQCEGAFLDLMMARFDVLGLMVCRPWLVVDTVGLSDEEEWTNAFRGDGGFQVVRLLLWRLSARFAGKYLGSRGYQRT